MSGAPEPADFRYRYPGSEAEFTLYNFHAQSLVDEVADVLSSQSGSGPRVIQVFGKQASGRHYLIRSPAFHASSRGTRVAVEKLDLDGYEPDTPLKGLLDFLSTRNTGASGARLTELSKRTRVDIKVNPINLLVAKLGISTSFSVDELSAFLTSDGSTSGPKMPGHNVLGILLDRLTKGHRFVLHLPSAHTADLSLIQHLIQEAKLRNDFFLSLGYPEQHAGTPHREANLSHLRGSPHRVSSPYAD